MSGRFGIPSWVSLKEERLVEMFERHERDIGKVVRGQEKSLTFEAVYNDQYNLMINKRGPQVYAMVVRALQTMTLAAEDWETFQKRMRLVLDLSMHLDRTWVPARTHAYTPLLVVAVHAWHRPVARRGRRVCRLVRWIVRIPKLLVPFNEVALAWGSQAAHRAAERFHTNASVYG